MATQSRAPVTLLTRPAAASLRFGQALLARRPEARLVISPLIAPRFLRPRLPERGWTALILTSEAGVQSAQRITADGIALPHLAFCVGSHTAEVARAAGFEARSADGDASALLRLILTARPEGPLLHLRGEDSRGGIAEQLNSAGLETFEAIAYEQAMQPLSPQAATLLAGDIPVIAPLFSPRTAEILALECRRIACAAPLTFIAMSAAVAEAVTAALPGRTVIAARPDAGAMLDAVVRELDAGRHA